MPETHVADTVEVSILLTRQAWEIAQSLAAGTHPHAASLLGAWGGMMKAEEILGMILEIQLKEQIGPG